MTTQTQDLNFKGQSVQKTEWKLTDGETDGRYSLPTALSSRLTRPVINE